MQCLLSKNEFYLDSISNLNESNILPGVIRVLDEAKVRGMKLAVGSSSKNAKFILNKIGLSDRFTEIVDGTMVENPKPNPEVFLKGAAAMGFSPNECVVFEDAESGIKAAKIRRFLCSCRRKSRNCRIRRFVFGRFKCFRILKIKN